MKRARELLTEQLPPGDLELEHAVLGAAVLDAEAARCIAAQLIPDDFLPGANRVVFTRIRELIEGGRSVDLLTLSRALSERGEFEEVGREKLAILAEAGASAMLVSEYAERLRGDGAKRRLIEIGSRLINGGYNGASAAGLIEAARLDLQQAGARVHPASSIEVRPIAASLARPAADLQIEYLWQDYIAARSLNAISAMPGTGKGKLVQGAMLTRSLGRSFPGINMQPGPCLFWSGEQGADEDDRVWQAFARGLGASAADFGMAQLMTISDPRRNLSDPAVRDELVNLASKHPGLLLVLDSLRRVMPGDENTSELPDVFFREVFLPLRAAGATVLLLAHPPKPPAQGDLRAESLIRGSGDWLAILDSFIVLKPAGRQVIEPGIEEIHATLTHVKARRGPKAEGGTLTIRVERDNTPEMSFALRLDADGASAVTKVQLALEELSAFFREHGMATRGEYLTAFDGRFSKRQLDPARKALVAQGLLRLLNPGENQRAHCWRWAEEGSAGPDLDAFTPGVHRSVNDDGEDD